MTWDKICKFLSNKNFLLPSYRHAEPNWDSHSTMRVSIFGHYMCVHNIDFRSARAKSGSLGVNCKITHFLWWIFYIIMWLKKKLWPCKKRRIDYLSLSKKLCPRWDYNFKDSPAVAVIIKACLAHYPTSLFHWKYWRSVGLFATNFLRHNKKIGGKSKSYFKKDILSLLVWEILD